jgi:hypothetical protein
MQYDHSRVWLLMQKIAAGRKEVHLLFAKAGLTVTERM